MSGSPPACSIAATTTAGSRGSRPSPSSTLRPADRRERRALSRARAARAAGRHDLHPRARHDRHGRPAARSQCRAASQSRRRRWRGCSAARRRRSTARCAFSTAAISRSANWRRPNTRTRTALGYATPQEALVALAEEGFAAPLSRTARIRKCATRSTASWRSRSSSITRTTFSPSTTSCAFARSKGILCQGRGSAANSVICYCLGITEVDPEKVDLLFERFVSEERKEPPDIDVDFEHERREEVIQYIYDKYGRHHASLTATVIRYRGRSAIREVGKVFGLSDDTVGALAGMLWGWSSARREGGRGRASAGLDPSDPRLNQVMKLDRRADRFSAPPLAAPRRLSHHALAHRRGRAGRECRDGGAHRHRVGQGRSRSAAAPEGRCARARHAVMPAARARSAAHALSASRPRSRRCCARARGRRRSADPSTA